MYSVFASNSRTLWRNVKQIGIKPLLKEENGVLNMVRPYAARKGMRAKKLAAAKEKKFAAAAASKPTATPKYLPKKIKQQSGKDVRRVTDENWLETSIIDDIWRVKFCRGKPYSLTDAIEMLQELHHPTMLNVPQAFVYATVELDIRQKKKNTFLQEFTGTVLYPHDFETGTSNRVVAICENPDEQLKASDAGAIYIGGVSLIKRIQKGEINTEDFDYVVCHLDLLKDLNKIRGMLKMFPSIKNGLLTTSMDKTVAQFIRCTEYTAKTSTLEPDFGWVDVCFGRLNMTHEKLEDNLKEILNVIEEKHKPVGVDNPLFITRTLLWSSKSEEKFKIPHWEFLPGYPLNGVVQPGDPVED